MKCNELRQHFGLNLVFSKDSQVCLRFVFLLDFLGRTEVSLANLVSHGKGPWHERLLLHEVETGEVVVNIELQLSS